jgi:hypothetical protein
MSLGDMVPGGGNRDDGYEQRPSLIADHGVYLFKEGIRPRRPRVRLISNSYDLLTPLPGTVLQPLQPRPETVTDSDPMAHPYPFPSHTLTP